MCACTDLAFAQKHLPILYCRCEDNCDVKILVDEAVVTHKAVGMFFRLAMVVVLGQGMSSWRALPWLCN